MIDNLIVSEVLRWGNSDKCLSLNIDQDYRLSSDCACDDHCDDCNDKSCYDCVCDNDDQCRSEW